jgi:hypothetical protein
MDDDTLPERTKDPVNQPGHDKQAALGPTTLGCLSNWMWHDDPRRMLFSMARYKFVAKMLSGRKNVLELGCGDAFNAPIVLQEVERLTVSDFDPLYIHDAVRRMRPPWTFNAFVHDLLSSDSIPWGPYDGIYALDVFEHIPVASEHAVLRKMVDALDVNGALIIGMPSLESQPHASAASKAGHVSCKSMSELRELMGGYFHHIFMFGMNDEVLHTGFAPMCHYIIALCCGKIGNLASG